jgi:hypothetical protein
MNISGRALATVMTSQACWPSSPEAVGAADIGLTHKDIHEARTIRDAEVADPGIVRRALDEKLDWPRPPHRASACRRGGAQADARFLWPQKHWHYRHWPGRALALSALVATELVARKAGSINPPTA